MTIDEVIQIEKYCGKKDQKALDELQKEFPMIKGIADNNINEQIAEWLEELKHYQLGDCMNDCEHYENCSNYIYSKGYNKAIDDFEKRIQSRKGYFEEYYPNDSIAISEANVYLEIANELKYLN